MNPPQSGTSLTEDAVQTIGGRNTRGDKSDSPGRRNEILNLDPALSPKCFLFPWLLAPGPRLRAPPHFRPRFILRRLLPFALPLVVQFLALGDGQLALDPAVLKVHFCGNQQQALLAGLPQELVNLPAMQQQLAVVY